MMERRGANKRGGHGPAPRTGCDRKERYNSGHINPKANPGMTAQQQGSAGHGLFLLQLALTAALLLITHIFLQDLLPRASSRPSGTPAAAARVRPGS